MLKDNNFVPDGDLRVIFMGTPEFAVASLKALLDARVNIVGIVTTPDKPQGRGQITKESDVKAFARSTKIPILTPDRLKDEIFINELRYLKPDLNVVVAFRMLPEVIWSMPPLGTINLHASLLPDYRGAAPINHAIINGETITGVTTFFIEKEIDTGKIIFSQNVDIFPDDNAGSLHNKLMLTGAELLVKTVFAIRDNDYKVSDQKVQQGNKQLQNAPKIVKETCRIDWKDNIDNIHNFVRGLSPYPGAWTLMQKLNSNEQISLKIYKTNKEICNHDLNPGTIITDHKNILKIAVTGGFLHFCNIQAEGRKRLDTENFLRGFKDIDSYKIIIP